MSEPRRCKAKSSRTGNPCKKAPILGGTVCQTHGGSAPQVKRKAEERLADLIDPDRALREAACVAYSDVGGFFNEGGNLRPIKEWPEELRRAVASVEVVKRNVDSGDGKTDDVIKLRFWDKTKGLEFLGKHLGLLKETLGGTLALEVSWKGDK